MRRFPWLVIIILMTIITISIFLTLIRTKHTVTVTKVTTQQYSTATPIRHVVIIILENHSFDNIYGAYPFGVPPIINNITLSLARPLGLNLLIITPYAKEGWIDNYSMPGYTLLAFSTQGLT